MKLVRAHGHYDAISKYGEWQAKEAGFQWDRFSKVWWTKDDSRALALLEYADDEVREHLKGVHQEAQRRDRVQPSYRRRHRPACARGPGVPALPSAPASPTPWGGPLRCWATKWASEKPFRR